MSQGTPLPFDLPSVCRIKLSVGFDGGQLLLHHPAGRDLNSVNHDPATTASGFFKKSLKTGLSSPSMVALPLVRMVTSS